MKKLNRREMLRIVATPVPILTFLPILTVCGRSTDEYEGIPQPARTFGAYLDVLLPADETPSATELGIHLTILTEGRFEFLIQEGCNWLDGEAGPLGADDFAGLDRDARTRLVAAAEASQPNTLPREFFVLSLDLAYEHYYSREQVWSSLGFRGPPQPRGYMDYDQPPSRTRT